MNTFHKPIFLVSLILIILNCKLFSQNKEFKTEADKPIICIDLAPEFSGGSSAMFKFISQNFRFPEEAQEVSGIIYLSFTVEEDGFITDIKVRRGLCCGLNEEAIRIINIMPCWKPAIFNGVPKKKIFTLPIRLELD